jgi:arsenate reductase
MKKILVLCTGNSCRSQMAEGFLKSFGPELAVYSAGTNPANKVSRHAVKVMDEAGVDISNAESKNVDLYTGDSFDYVITVCDNAKETCPLFTGKVKNLIHLGFEDPAEAAGTEEEILSTYRRIRDEIKAKFAEFYLDIIKE